MTRRAVRYAIRNHFSIDYHRPPVPPFLLSSFFLSFPRSCHGKNIFRPERAASGTFGKSRFMKQRIFELQIKSARHEYRAPFHVSINFSIATRRNGKKRGKEEKKHEAGRKQKQDKRTKKSGKDGPGPLLTRSNYFTWIRS